MEGLSNSKALGHICYQGERARDIAESVLKILHVIASADPRGGGPIEGVIRSSEAIAKLGHSAALATLDRPNDPWLKDFPFPIFPLGPSATKSSDGSRWPWGRYGYSPKVVPWLKAHASEYDAIVVNGLWNYAAAAASRALRASKYPYFVYTHGMLDPWFRQAYPLKTMLKQGSWWLFEGPLLAHARRVLFTCEEERMLARNAFWPYRVREAVVGYGAAESKGDPEAQIAKFYIGVPQLRDRQYLLFLSRIHPKKGCDLLINAFATIAAHIPNLDLVIAGPDDSGWGDDLKGLATSLGVADRLHWPGMLSGDEKWGAFLGCEAFVLPSHQENFGVVVAEALACGKPVLITDKVNIWREINANGAGLIAPDSKAGIESLLNQFTKLSADDRRRMGDAGRRTFLECFDIERNAGVFLQVLRDGLSDERA